MKKYCIDTSGLSNPLESMPSDIYVGLWSQITLRITAGNLACTSEIYEELTHLDCTIGQCINDNECNLKLAIVDANLLRRPPRTAKGMDA